MPYVNNSNLNYVGEIDKKIVYKKEPEIYKQTIERKDKNYRTILYCYMFGICLMFACLTLMYYISHYYATQTMLQLSPIFYVSTFLVIISSVSLEYTIYIFKKARYLVYKRAIYITFLLGFSFLTLQSIACFEMYRNGQNFSNSAPSYLYVLTALHALHLLGCVLFLSFFIIKHYNILKEYATSIVFFSDILP